MRLRMVRAGLTVVLFLAACPHGGETSQAQAETRTSRVINQPGEFGSPDGRCRAVLGVAGMGGFFILTMRGSGRAKLRVEDVTGIAWVGGHTLVYTTSPIYGVPGVYVYGCKSSKAKRIVAPRTVTKANPDGADFFELERVSAGRPTTLYFYYAPDVDKVDFNVFRAPAFLYRVHLDGSDFRKADPPTR